MQSFSECNSRSAFIPRDRASTGGGCQKRVLLLIVIFCFPLCFGFSQEPKGCLSNVRRYLDVDMANEAIACLDRVVAEDEFNAQVRLALGEALRLVKNYDRSIEVLRTARKLDPKLWPSTERLAGSYLMRWFRDGNLADRVAGAELFEEVASLPEKASVVVELFNYDVSVEYARNRARYLLAGLGNPERLWKTSYGTLYRMSKGDTVWALEPVEKKGLVFFLTYYSDGSFRGRAAQWINCIQEYDVELGLSEHGTKMSVDGRFQKLIGPQLEGTESRSTVKFLMKFCEKMASPVGTKEIHVDFVRVE